MPLEFSLEHRYLHHCLTASLNTLVSADSEVIYCDVYQPKTFCDDSFSVEKLRANISLVQAVGWPPSTQSEHLFRPWPTHYHQKMHSSSLQSSKSFYTDSRYWDLCSHFGLWSKENRGLRSTNWCYPLLFVFSPSRPCILSLAFGAGTRDLSPFRALRILAAPPRSSKISPRRPSY